MDTHQIEDSLLNLALGVDQARHARIRGKQGKDHLKRDALLLKQFASERPWGMEVAIDLFWCNPASIRDPENIRAFAIALCDVIQMHRYGEPLIVHFGKEERVSGYTLVQLIETSNITAHFIDHATPEQGNAGCLNIFSCASFPPFAAAAFCQEWFEAKEIEVAVTFRGPTHTPGFQEQATTGEGEDACSHQ